MENVDSTCEHSKSNEDWLSLTMIDYDWSQLKTPWPADSGHLMPSGETTSPSPKKQPIPHMFACTLLARLWTQNEARLRTHYQILDCNHSRILITSYILLPNTSAGQVLASSLKSADLPKLCSRRQVWSLAEARSCLGVEGFLLMTKRIRICNYPM